jgi:glyoxalase family protein
MATPIESRKIAAAALDGFHHVTAIAGDPRVNFEFYTSVLGLRLVKRTVNFDDPSAYHLYYGDGVGTPGTLLTFFAQPRVRPGSPGNGMINTIVLAVPEGSLPFWRDRLLSREVQIGEAGMRFGERRLPFRDPDGLQLELAAVANAPHGEEWDDQPVPVESAICGLRAVVVASADPAPTIQLLGETLGFEQVAEEEGRIRLRAPITRSPAYYEIDRTPRGSPGQLGAGVAHHVAWQTEGVAANRTWRQRLADERIETTDLKDRRYFQSIYFREPGGVLFEFATNGPGFTFDEPFEQLGSELKLPPELENRRDEIAKRLLRLD